MFNPRRIFTKGTYKGIQLEEPHKILIGILTLYNNGNQLECYLSKNGDDYNHMCLVDEKTIEHIK